MHLNLMAPVFPQLDVNIPEGWWKQDAQLDLDFANKRAYNKFTQFRGRPDSILTYTSPSPKMVYENDGVLRYAPHNLFTYSEQFDNAAWTKTASSITANAAAAPDGTTTADALVENTATSVHDIYRLPGTGAGTYTLSLYVKANGRTQLKFTQESGGDSLFTLSGSGTAVALGSNTVSIASVGNGWYRCSSTFTTTGAFGVYISLYNSGASNYTGDGVSGIYIWGAQFSRGVTLFTYIPTTTAAVYSLPIDHNPTTFAPLGVLIEEQRTNLLTYAQDISNVAWTKGGITVSNTTGKDGVSTSAQLTVATSANTEHYHNHSATLTAATIYTFSRYVKASGYNYVSLALGASRCWATFDLTDGTVSATSSNGVDFSTQSASITAVGDGWYRITLTATCLVTAGYVIMSVVSNTDMTSSYTKVFVGDAVSGIIFYGAQLEAGAFATSYIPTIASQVTRAADQVSIPTSAFAFSQTEGSVVAHMTPMALSSGNIFNVNAGALDATSIYSTPNVSNHLVVRDTATQVNIDAGTFVVSQQSKIAVAYKANDFAASIDGGAAVTDTSGTIPASMATLCVGTSAPKSGAVNGHIKRLTYFSTSKTNAELQGLTI